MDIFLLTTAATLLNHVAIPSIMMKEVSKIKKRLYDSLNSYKTSLKDTSNSKNVVDNLNNAVAFNATLKSIYCYLID